MTFNSFLEETRAYIKETIGPFCTERACDPIKLVESSFELEKNPLSLCIFPTASNGSTFYEEGNADMVRLTVMFYANRTASGKGVLQAEKYFSVLIQYLQKTTFGEASSLAESTLIRMDEGEPVNGALFNIEARINTHMDYGWD